MSPFICKKCGYDLELSPICECKSKTEKELINCNKSQMNKKFAATYSEAVQIGEFEFKQIRTTKIFSYNDSFLSVVEWLESIGVKEPNINSVDISEVTE